MRTRLIAILSFLLPVLLWAAPTINTNKTAYPASPFMASVMTNVDAAGVRSAIGVGTGTNTFSTDQFETAAGVTIKDGAQITNTFIKGGTVGINGTNATNYAQWVTGVTGTNATNYAQWVVGVVGTNATNYAVARLNGGATNLTISDGTHVGPLKVSPNTTNSWAVTHGFSGGTNEYDRAIFYGHSWMAGDGVSFVNPFPFWWTNLFWTNLSFATNMGLNASYANYVWTNFNGQVAPLATAGGTNCWLFLQTGLNDLWAGSNAAVIWGLVSNTCYAARATNITVVIYTEPKTGNEIAFDNNRIAYNNLIRNNPQVWDYLVDLERQLDPQIIGAAHPTAMGAYLQAKLTYDMIGNGNAGYTKMDPRYAPKNRTLYVDGQKGDDTRGLPYKTIDAAAAASTDWDTIRIAPGNYTNTAMVVMKTGVKIVGSGWRNTYIISTSAVISSTIRMTNDCMLADLSVDRSAGYTVDCNKGTNMHLLNIAIYGDADGYYWLSPGPVNGQADNCYFKTSYDNFNSGSSDTNTFWRFNHCTFDADNAYRTDSSISRNIAGWAGTIVANNCEFLVNGKTAQTVTRCIDGYDPGPGPSHWFYANNCSFRITGISTNAFTIYNYDEVGAANGTTNFLFISGSTDLTRALGPMTLNNVPITAPYTPTSGGVATNAIENLNGLGTNTTLTGATLNNASNITLIGTITGDGSGLTNITATATNAIANTNGIGYSTTLNNPTINNASNITVSGGVNVTSLIVTNGSELLLTNSYSLGVLDGLGNPSTSNRVANLQDSTNSWKGSQVLSNLAGLANSAGVLTNNGSGTLSWVAVGGGGGATSLTNLQDAGFTYPQTNGDLLMYDSASGKWTNKQPSFASATFGDLTMTGWIKNAQMSNCVTVSGTATNSVANLLDATNVANALITGATNFLANTNVYATTNWVGATFAPTGVVNTLIANATNYLANTNVYTTTNFANTLIANATNFLANTNVYATTNWVGNTKQSASTVLTNLSTGDGINVTNLSAGAFRFDTQTPADTATNILVADLTNSTAAIYRTINATNNIYIASVTNAGAGGVKTYLINPVASSVVVAWPTNFVTFTNQYITVSGNNYYMTLTRSSSRQAILSLVARGNELTNTFITGSISP